MSDLTRERVRVFLIGLAAAVVAVLARAVLFRFVGTAIPFLTFFPAVIAAALWAGTRGGTVASLLSLILAPIWMTTRWGAMDQIAWLNLVFFGLTCALIV